MSKEVVPAWGIETVTDLTPFNTRIDNNVVHVAGRIFDTYVPCDFANATQQAGGLGMMEQVIFTETEEKPIPEALKDGTMAVSDVWVVIQSGPAYKG